MYFRLGIRFTDVKDAVHFYRWK